MDAAASVGRIFLRVGLLVFCCDKELQGGVVHTDIVDGEGEPMPRFEDGNRGTRLTGFRRREIRHLAGGGQRRNGLAESPSVRPVVS